MNRFSSRQRKISYVVGLLVLLVPIVWLGMPASQGSTLQGHLAGLRTKYDLGETDLGKVDPTSVTMNLVLLGLRGVAANLLWIDANEQQSTKNWAQLRSDVNSIILLQPHFREVWRHHGWNLAYNVSVEWDAVEDRYYWVKEGGKFLMDGTRRNQTYSELYWETGRILGDKIGNSDEWRDFRKFFVVDPDVEKYDGGTDPELNPFGRDDNYLAAKDKFFEANKTESVHGQTMMMRVLFRQWPYRSQMNYAATLQREGNFGEVARIAWEDSYREWIDEYGQEPFKSTVGDVRLAATNGDLMRWAEEREDATYEEIKATHDMIVNLTKFDYWAVRARSEAEPETLAAHREIYDGQLRFKEAKLNEASDLLEAGMKKFARLLDRHPQLKVDDTAIEEAMMAMLYWRYSFQLRNMQPPNDYALKTVWDENQNRLMQLMEEFRFENGL